MRVAFFSQGFGNASFVCNQFELVSEINEVKYFTTALHNTERFPSTNVEVIEYSSKGVLNFLKLRLQWRDLHLNFHRKAFSRKLQNRIKVFSPDIIHCQFGWEALLFFHNFDVPDYIPIIVQFRGFDASEKLQSRVYVSELRKVLSRPNVHPVFVCEHLYKNLESKGLPLSDHTILYSNTDIDFFQRTSPLPVANTYHIVQVSSFREKKGHKYTLLALSLLRERNPEMNWKMTFTGPRSPERDRIMALSQELNIDDRIYFVGDISPREVRTLLSSAHLFVLHSVTTKSGDQEGIPNALMEAMSMELPVVSTIHAGIPELVEDGVHGMLVAERDVSAYASAIYETLQKGLLRGNRTKIIEKFSASEHQEKLIALYTRLLDRTMSSCAND